MRVPLLLTGLLLASAFAGCAAPATDAHATPTPAAPSATPTPGAFTASFHARDGFDDATVGAAPPGWTAQSGTWTVEANATAPSAPHVVRQSNTTGKFPILTLDSTAALADVDVSARFSVHAGELAKAGGVVFRFVDGDNHYAARANGNEGNFALFRTVAGNRLKLIEAEAPTGMDTWLSIAVEARGSQIKVFNGPTLLFTYVEGNATAPKAGKVGLWTKDDSVTLFDDLDVTGYVVHT